ncbi:MAG: WecB/TagA/CpsF family glycosyltransferase [Candidatus Dormiibacterota bacterium]
MPGAGVSSTSISPGPLTEGPARVELLGIPVDCCTLEQARARCESAGTREAGPLQVVTLNPEMVMQARRQPSLARAIRGAGLILPDGTGVVWASRRLGTPVPERIAGADFLDDLAEMSVGRNWSIFLLGGAPGVAGAAARALEQAHPGLLVGGVWAGSPAADEADSICTRIRSSGAAVLAVAFGVPEQDLWLSNHLEETGARVGIGVGGTLDYLAGRLPRAPAALRKAGLEWSFRLARQPWRLPRMLRGAPFFWEVVRESLRPSPS